MFLFGFNQYEYINFAEWWDTLSASFISYYFIVFVFILVLIYYLIPKRGQWIVLLTGSSVFYLLAGIEAFITVLLSSFITFCAAICINSTEKTEKKKRRFYFFSGIIILLSVLVFAKCYSLFNWRFNYIVPLGISYYSFSAIAYLADVYWSKEQAERNYFKLLLFLLFFPKILQGPISRHRKLGPQLSSYHYFNWEKFCFGIQLAIWGYFKKLVVADRLAILTSTAFGNFENYGGSLLLIAILLSAVQLFCDFSGCMDIAIGIAEMFGIELEQNFNHPFFAKSASEFWQKWHMSLTSWFTDYLFLPVSRSKGVKKLSKSIGNKLGPDARKNSIVLISSLIVWLATGLWHGTGIPYVVWGLYWYVLINISLLLSKPIEKIIKLFHIKNGSFGWKMFQMIRTYLFFCLGRLITIPNNLKVSGTILLKVFSKFNIWELFDGTLYNLGLTWQELLIAFSGIALVWIVGILQQKYSIREKISQWNLVIRCLFYATSVILILIIGKYGPGYGNTTFVYMNF